MGININEMGRDAAVVKVAARMFNLRFDVLWQRLRREESRRKKIIIIGLVILMSCISLIAMWIGTQNVKIKNQNAELEDRYRIINEQNEQIQRNKE